MPVAAAAAPAAVDLKIPACGGHVSSPFFRYGSRDYLTILKYIGCAAAGKQRR